ncbi:hypothetical protein BGX28_009478 [Mortierella sp. GBA30]|nr:hypothetical protein BGX28_009478 [Mortierella sp. GBA30]
MKLTTASLITVFGILAVAVTSAKAQLPPRWTPQECDEAFSSTLGDCILAHPKDPSNPERMECVRFREGVWGSCYFNP